MDKPMYQESTEKHQTGSLVAEYSLNMSMVSGSIPTPKNLLNANNKTLRRRGEGRQNGWENSGKGEGDGERERETNHTVSNMDTLNIA